MAWNRAPLRDSNASGKPRDSWSRTWQTCMIKSSSRNHTYGCRKTLAVCAIRWRGEAGCRPGRVNLLPLNLARRQMSRRHDENRRRRLPASRSDSGLRKPARCPPHDQFRVTDIGRGSRHPVCVHSNIRQGLSSSAFPH